MAKRKKKMNAKRAAKKGLKKNRRKVESKKKVIARREEAKALDARRKFEQEMYIRNLLAAQMGGQGGNFPVI